MWWLFRSSCSSSWSISLCTASTIAVGSFLVGIIAGFHCRRRIRIALENLLILVTKDWPSSRIHDPGEELVNKRAQCTRTQVGSLSRSREAYRSATLPPRHTVTHKQMSLLINTHNEHTQASLGLQNSTVRQYLSDDLCWGETHTRNYAFLHRCLGVTRSFFSLTSTSLAPPICYQ
jgi:hypothetical protein